jgi:DNA-binding MarR family transcriptional regulator
MNTDEYSFHPIADGLPHMSDFEYAAFCKDVAQNGLREPIVLFEGQILDGRHRYQACWKAGVERRYECFEGTWDEAIEFVISKNLRRRNLNKSQMAMVAAKFATMRRGYNPQNCGTVSQAEAAKRFNVSERLVTSAAKVLKDGVQELQQMTEDGIIAVSDAAKIASKPRTTQMRFIRKGKDRIADALSQIRVENTIKQAHTCHDLLICCNSAIKDVTEENFVAFLQHLSFEIRKKKGGPLFARYIAGIVDEISETQIIQGYQTVEQKIFASIRDIAQTESDLIQRTKVGKDEMRYALNQLENYGFIEQKPAEKTTAMARGRVKMLWHLTEKGRKEADRKEEMYNLDDGFNLLSGSTSTRVSVQSAH